MDRNSKNIHIKKSGLRTGAKSIRPSRDPADLLKQHFSFIIMEHVITYKIEGEVEPDLV